MTEKELISWLKESYYDYREKINTYSGNTIASCYYGGKAGLCLEVLNKLGVILEPDFKQTTEDNA